MNAKKKKQTHILVVVIGALLVAMSVYGIITKGDLIDHVLNITLGISLVGVGLMELYPKSKGL